jgi:hypothetical protein
LHRWTKDELFGDGQAFICHECSQWFVMKKFYIRCLISLFLALIFFPAVLIYWVIISGSDNSKQSKIERESAKLFKKSIRNKIQLKYKDITSWNISYWSCSDARSIFNREDL